MRNLLFTLVTCFLVLNCSSERLEGFQNEEPLNYENGNLSTGSVSSNGLQTPQGFVFNEREDSLNPGINSFTLNFQEKARYSVSDDFIIPSNEIWSIENFYFYFINPATNSTSTPFPGHYLVMEIYDGDPLLSTSKKVYGDFDTNLFVSSEVTNIYSIWESTTDINDADSVDPVHKVKAKINGNLNLKGGHYWYKMTLKFDYGEDWNCYVPRLPQKGNTATNFNAYTKSEYNNLVFYSDRNLIGTVFKFETPFNITGTKTIN